MRHMTPPADKEKKLEAPPGNVRRSTRLSIALPVTLTGTDKSGQEFAENTRTIIVNKHGAKVSTCHQLVKGTEVSIENRALGRTAKAIVVWIGEKRLGKDLLEIALELTKPENIWAIEFPPDDWETSDVL